MVSPGKIITLEEVPEKPDELEEFVAALFQSSRHFVEKKVIDRVPKGEILELDAVATLYDSGAPVATIIEAKSGDWGFAEIFKVFGWMNFLKITQGGFFVSKEIDKDLELVKEKCSEMNIRFVHLGNFADASGRFVAAGFPEPRNAHLLTVWRLSYWVERELISQLRSRSKSNKDEVGCGEALRHLHLINNETFFTPSVRKRLNNLYEAFQKHPKIALAIAIEISGGKYDPTAVDPKNQLIKEAMYEGRHPAIQAAFYVEHRARLAILKAAIDHEQEVASGRISPPVPISRSTFTLSNLRYEILPQSFKDGLEHLKQQRSFMKYALFWQVFLWGFGGFYLEDRKAEEFSALADQTGVPVEDIPEALKAFDVLFPTPKGWLVRPGATQAVRVKMMPHALHGIGALHRKLRYGIKQYRELGYSDYTGHDLASWHNAMVDRLGS